MNWKQHPVLQAPTLEEMAQMEPEELVRIHKLYHEAIANAERDPYRYGFVLPHWKYADNLLAKFRTLLLLGANRCLAGEQEVFDPVAGKPRRVDSVDGNWHVYAYDEKSNSVVIAEAEKPFRKPAQKLFRVELSNGQTLSCSAEHRVLTPFGWKAVGELKRGSLVHAPLCVPYGANSVAYTSIVNTYLLREDTVWDFTVPTYHNYIAAGVTNHNSGKTNWGARKVVQSAIENEGALIYCFSQNQETSIVVQQAAIYEWLPVELKKKATHETHYISFSMQNGFAGNSLVLPNKSRILFKTYAQYQQNQSILEGMELGSRTPKVENVGAWLDEYLQGMEMIDRLYLRLATRDAKLLITFTPKDGVTETVKYFIGTAQTVETRKAELLKNREVPYIQHNEQRNTGIIYFHSKDNPWSGYKTIVEQCKAKGDDEYTLTAAYGVPTRSATSKFPNFSREVNVVKHESIPRAGLTKYMVIDPAGRKNWFMAWIGVDASDTWWVYREWPGVNVGDWAVERNGKWGGGEGARTLGYGIQDYVRLIGDLEAETKDQVFERLIDPRLGAAKYQAQNGASSIIEDLADAGLVCIPAPGLDIEDGLQALQTKMSYDRKKPVDALNRPHFYISERCQNIISALEEYTGEDGLEEAWKDPVDTLRYAAIDGIRYVDPKVFSKRNQIRGY